MRRERGARLRSAMADKGVDALVLLGNTNVVVRHRRELAAERRGPGQRRAPVAVVLADDECAAPVHAVPRRRPARARAGRRPPARPDLPRLRRGRRAPSPRTLADLVPGDARRSPIDDVTGAMHRDREAAVRRLAARATASEVMGRGPGGQDARRAGLHAPRRCGSPSRPWPRCRPGSRPGVRQTDLTATFLRRVFELGAEANVLDPIWQVMPDRQADAAVDRRTATSPARC